MGYAMRRARAPAKHDAAVWQKVQTLACQQPESQGRWSVRTLAREVGLPSSTVHAILNASKLQPPRIRTFTVNTRDTGDDYVKVTVFLATVLLLTALSQRFRILGPRIAVAAVAVILLFVSAYWLLTLPRA